MGLFVQQIYEELNFTEKLIQKLKFYVEQLLPVITSNDFFGIISDASTSLLLITLVMQTQNPLYCYCHCEEYGKMIHCENEKCCSTSHV